MLSLFVLNLVTNRIFRVPLPMRLKREIAFKYSKKKSERNDGEKSLNQNDQIGLVVAKKGEK